MAICQKSLEVLPLFSRSACDTLICINVHHAPVFFSGDQVCVVPILSGEGVELVIGSRADTGVSSYPQLDVLLLFSSLYRNNSALLFLQGHTSIGQLLFLHVSSPPYSNKHYHTFAPIAITKCNENQGNRMISTPSCTER